ncbi:MAG: hypothetical protein R3B84_01810 [Zavarzinella sp.]
MTQYHYIAILFLLLGLLVFWWLRRHFRTELELGWAAESFRLQQELLQEMFIAESRKSGKPKGLQWVSCQFDSAPAFIQDKQHQRLIVLVEMLIQFEPIPGSDMEDNPAAREPRLGTAVFFVQKKSWSTEGKIFLNLRIQNAYQTLMQSLSLKQ